MNRRIACSIELVFKIKSDESKVKKLFTFHHRREPERILTFNEITNSFIKSYRVFIRLIGIDCTLDSLE
jgi:hypothetical protein